MNFINQQPTLTREEELAGIIKGPRLDMRTVSALAGDRTLNAREQDMIQRLQSERGEGLYSDVLYALTHKSFPPRQARQLWQAICTHRELLKRQLGRDAGICVAAHDYLVNMERLLSDVSLIDARKLESFANVATRDGMTGLIDHATFQLNLREEMERQSRYGGKVSLVMLDIDHFKQINDTFGHTEGDRVICQLADILRTTVRRMDVAARYGGEEFAVILPEVDTEAAFIFAERLRQKVETAFAQGSIQVTISAGIATSNSTIAFTPADLIKTADAHLYAAKKAGRNRVMK